jgi:hypothetical protein
MKALWHTLWQAHDIAVCRDGKEVDRFDAQQIERVLLLHRGVGDSPGDVLQVVIELAEECLVFSADTGIAGRINFERQAFWAERGCVHWVSHARAPLPLRLRTGSGLFRLSPPPFMRVPRAELAALIARWPIQGAQTWDERKRRRIERAQPLSFEHA